MSVFNDIAAAIVTALSASPAVSSSITRNRVRPLAEEQTSGVVVRILSSQATPFAVQGGPMLWDTLIGIECYGRSATLSADEATDALLEAVYERLAANASLGGLAEDLQIQAVTWTQDAADKAIGCATAEYLVRHRTANNTLN